VKPARPLAIVTGGAGLGVGIGVSTVLLRDNWDVLVVDRDAELSARMIVELAADDSMKALSIDLTDQDAPQQVTDAAMAWRGRVDALVNNAGIGCVAPADDLTDEQFDTVFSINVRAAFRLTRQVMKHLAISSGAIVNISSVHGRQPVSGFSAYAATKGAIEAMTRGWAVDFGPRGIRVNCVVPGMIDCPQTRQVTSNYVENVEAYLQQWARSRQLLPRLVTNMDVGELVSYLLGPKANGVTGQCIVIDAGTTLLLTDRD
jgi:NAD(P)-dependent dehydrogenase (short-subunit alcohol dehydrogenase family)